MDNNKKGEEEVELKVLSLGIALTFVIPLVLLLWLLDQHLVFAPLSVIAIYFITYYSLRIFNRPPEA